MAGEKKYFISDAKKINNHNKEVKFWCGKFVTLFQMHVQSTKDCYYAIAVKWGNPENQKGRFS